MIRRTTINAFFLVCIVLLLTGCQKTPSVKVQYRPGNLQFSGDKALAFVENFVGRFPDRDSGKPNNKRAAEWLKSRFESYGMATGFDRWEVVNYSKPVLLQNVIGKIQGESSKEILVVAHLDQSPDTIQGADNDGSGIAVMMQLAKIFAAGPVPEYTLVFLASDAEEYGMLGTRRYIQTHPEPKSIIAGLSLDNVGKSLYKDLRMDPRGQFRGYGALWFQRYAQAAARAAGNLWIPRINLPVIQILDQAVPVSFMDEGPIVAEGIPSFGLAGWVPPKDRERHWETYHSPGDRMELQSAISLFNTGRVSEALLRQCLSMKRFPQETGPYIYFEKSRQVLRGAPLWLIFILIVLTFFFFAFRFYQQIPGEQNVYWKAPFLHFFSLWLPLTAGILLLYIFVAVGLMDTYHLYPATPKDEPLFQPRWTAVTLWGIGLMLFFLISSKTVKKREEKRLPGRSEFYQRKAIAMAVIGIAGVYLLAINAFSLLFIVPLFFWTGIAGRKGARGFVDWGLFLMGGVFIYVLIYFFGFVVLRNDFAILWYLMMMFSIQMISFPTALVITGVIAAGLLLMTPAAA